MVSSTSRMQETGKEPDMRSRNLPLAVLLSLAIWLLQACSRPVQATQDLIPGAGPAVVEPAEPARIYPEQTFTPSALLASAANTALVPAPQLTGEYLINCEKGDSGIHRPKAGDLAVGFTLNDLAGNPVNLAEVLRKSPAVLILGSFT